MNSSKPGQNPDRRNKARVKRSEVESQIGEAVSRFIKENFGRGPSLVRVYWMEDIVLVRYCGSSFPLEMLASGDSPRTNNLARELRRELIAIGRESLDLDLERLTGCKVLSVLTDANLPLSEHVIVFLMEAKNPSEPTTPPRI